MGDVPNQVSGDRVIHVRDPQALPFRTDHVGTLCGAQVPAEDIVEGREYSSCPSCLSPSSDGAA